jgi:hypothetical protein
VKKTPFFLILGLSGAGLLSGLAARRLTLEPATAALKPPPVETTTPAAVKTPQSSDSKASKSAPPLGERRRSVDTLETLATLDGGSLYARLADWLMDASEQDIAAYWATYQNGKRTNDLTDLVFLNWTRLNPQAAIAATAGGKDEHYAWWAWACHDPKASLAAAIATNPDRVNNVTWGIGEFHPEWLRAHFKELPESA